MARLKNLKSGLKFMGKIKVSELFYSIQGEGRYMGVPSVFLRTFGCNFRCRGFGRAKDSIPADEKMNPEVARVLGLNELNPYASYGELPLVTSGCDTYAAIYPEFKHLSPLLTTDALADSIVDLLPHREWRDEHLVITGGEPLLGWQRSYIDLLEHRKMSSLKEITFETNGTQRLTQELYDYFFEEWTRHGRDYDRLTFSVSPKLSVSGESWEDAICPRVVMQYQALGYTYLKFVVATEADAAEAERAVSEYRAIGFGGPVYLMPVGGVESVYALNNRRVAELAMARGWRYSDRLQVPLFKNEWGT
jgi:organic radical activating enzyme